MKKHSAMIVSAVLTAVLTLSACTTNTPAPAVTDIPTEQDTTLAMTEEVTDPDTEIPSQEITEAPTEEITEAPTEEDTQPVKPELTITDGMMLYFEDFSSYGDVVGLENTVNALGWKIQTVENDYAYKDWTAQMAIQNGALVVTNYDKDAGFKGGDSYASILESDYMRAIAQYGDYTVQYDLTYTDASNYKRYICLLTDYYGDTYNSFHFRVGGYGNNQGHLYDEWYTYDVIDPAVDQAANITANSTEKGTTIAYKLLGVETAIKDDTAIENFRNVTVTIRIQHDSDKGNIIYMKTSDMQDFVCVSMPSENATGINQWYESEGCPGLAFKVGGAVNGTVDNIAMWAGFGEMPEDTTVTYQP